MTKEELLRVYSAYLPYDVIIASPNNKNGSRVSMELKGRHILDDGSLCNPLYKLVLYDLSYLTKDEFNFIWENETDTESLEQALSLDTESFLSCKFSYSFWTELFKNHFNVFNLPEGEYINKATLTNK